MVVGSPRTDRRHGSSTYRRGRLLLGSVCSVWPHDSWQGACRGGQSSWKCARRCSWKANYRRPGNVTRRRGRLVVESQGELLAVYLPLRCWFSEVCLLSSEVLPIVVATWFLTWKCLDLGSIRTVVVMVFWKFTYRRLGS